MILSYTLAYGATILAAISVGYVGTKIADKYIRKQKEKEENK